MLGPSITYSCDVWPSMHATLENAQAAKDELIRSKLDPLGCSPKRHSAPCAAMFTIAAMMSLPEPDLNRGAFTRFERWNWTPSR